MSDKLDVKRGDDYRATAGRFRILDLPPQRYLAIDGHGDPPLRDPDGLEQATRPVVAALHAQRMAAAGARTVADLGCGLGDTPVDLSRRFPQATFVGVETAPLSFALAWLRCLPRRNCQVRYRDLWRVELGEFDVVY